MCAVRQSTETFVPNWHLFQMLIQKCGTYSRVVLIHVNMILQLHTNMYINHIRIFSEICVMFTLGISNVSMETYDWCHGNIDWCHGNIWLMPSKHTTDAMETYDWCYGNIQLMPWKHMTGAMETYNWCHGNIQLMPWKHMTDAMETYNWCHGNIWLMLWKHTTDAMEIHNWCRNV